MLHAVQREPLVYRSPGVGVRRVAQLRRSATAACVVYLLVALACTLAWGFLALAGFLAFFAYAGLPLVAHWQRVSDPGTQTSAGWLYHGTLTIGETDVVVEGTDGMLAVPRSEITDGWVEPFGQGGHRVVLRHRDGDLGVVEVESLAAGNAILEAVGFSADRHALRVRTSGNEGQTLREMALVGAAFFLSIPLLALGLAEDPGSLALAGAATAATLGVTALLARATIKPVVRVGIDGIAITRGRERTFVPVREVTSVNMTSTGIELWTSTGQRPHLLRCWGVQQAALFARIQEVVRGFGGAAASAAQLARLDRQGRDLAGWREALRRVASDDAGDYRRIGLAREDLARLLAQGDAPAERRIGAALALASSGDPAERERVRIAARACAEDELRVALERIAEDEADEATVDAALRARTIDPG